MDQLHRRSPTSGSCSSILEKPPHCVRSTVPTLSTLPHSSPMQTFPEHQLPIPSPQQKPANANTFVHKLYNMVVDSQYQHLIAWNYTGSSFIVCNIMEFSREVLPKHFKHNNFSSFVRQLNMYGFHKVNKSPRGHRTLAENQIWEFSHPKFLRNRPDLLDDIKRKAMETTTDNNSRRENGDLHAHLAMMQVAQSDMMQQISQLFGNFNQLVKELEETKRKQANQQQLMKSMAQYISQQNGGRLPAEVDIDVSEQPPSIFITSPDHSTVPSTTSTAATSSDVYPSPLSIQTQNLQRTDLALPSSCVNRTSSYLGPFLPPSPSPSSMLSDDEANSLYSPRSPRTPLQSQQSSSSSNTSRLATSHDQQPASFTFANPFDPLSHR